MSGELPAVFVRCFIENNLLKEGLPFDEEMQSECTPVHRPHSPPALTLSIEKAASGLDFLAMKGGEHENTW